MNLEEMSKDQLIEHIRKINSQLDNVVVLWGDKNVIHSTLEEVSRNEADQFTPEEVANAQIILEKEGAFDAFIDLLRTSFDRGGINHAISEKMSALMEETANRYRG